MELAPNLWYRRAYRMISDLAAGRCNRDPDNVCIVVRFVRVGFRAPI